MGNVKFTDYRIKVEGAMDSLAVKALHEVSGSLAKQIARNTPVGKVGGGQLKRSWNYRVSKTENGCVSAIGSPLERAIWIEYGTGEYALPASGKQGRKGGWYIPIGAGKNEMSEAVAKAYGFAIRKGSGGRKFVFTMGMKPVRPAFTTYMNMRTRIAKRIQSIFKGGMSI